MNSKGFFKSIWFFVLVILIILLCIFGIICYFNNKVTDEDRYYESMMEKYGFAKFYDNKKSTPYENVKNSELIKMIIVANLEISYNEMERYADINFKNDRYVLQAINYNIIREEDINSSNYSNDATFLQLVDYLTKAKISIKSIELTNKNTYTFKDADSLINTYLNDLVENQIIEYDNSIKLNRKLKKRDVNKFIVKYVNKYNLLSFDGKKLKIDISTLPKNYEEYPYVLEETDNYIYEIPFDIYNSLRYIDPIVIYKNFKDIYLDYDLKVKEFFEITLNIDYTNINEDSFYEKINELSVYTVSREDVQKYIKFLKENKVILKGSATPYLPIVYFDGLTYRIRTKINFEVVSSNTLNDLLFYDYINESNYTFEKNNEYMCDLKLSTKRNESALYIYASETSKIKLDENK